MSTEKTMKAFLERKNRLDDVEREGREATTEETYDKEFAKLREMSTAYKTGNVYPTVEGKKQCNISKNRYKDIVPFDQTRVKLKNVKDDSGNDYINASFIKGAVGQIYIAAQGPLPKTVNDFWQMIWENNVHVIFMACREFEGIPLKLKCQRYWPNSTTEEMIFGSIKVTLAKEETTEYKEHLIRHMIAKSGNESRTVIQLHYLEWPDKDVPRCIDGILHLIERFRNILELNKDETSLALVHCSAGCGRTGTILVIDYIHSLLRYGKLPNDFSIFDIVAEMRRQRMAIVQSNEQYVFVHEVVAKLFERQLNLIDSHIYGNMEQSRFANSKPKVILPCADYEILENTDKMKPARPIPSSKPVLPKVDGGGSFKKDRAKGNTEKSPDGSHPSSFDNRSMMQNSSLPKEPQYAVPFASPAANKKPPLVRSSSKPKTDVPSTATYGVVQKIVNNNSGADKTSKQGDYSYADPYQTGKWSLQEIALGKKVESAYASIDDIDYQTDSRGSSANAEIGGGDETSSQQLPSKENHLPIMNTILSMLNINKQDQPQVITNSCNGCDIAQVIFRDVNISFPNRVGKPLGKRPVKTAQVSPVH